jgi:transposase
MAILGIDVSKETFDAALLGENGKIKTKVFGNTAEGFSRLFEWLEQQGIDQVHACLESTGVYGKALAEALFDAGHTVSVENPAKVKGFGQSELSRTKTDKADSALIARFCQALKPRPWTPPPPEIRRLRELDRRRDDLVAMVRQEENRLESVREKAVRKSLREVVAYLKRKQKQIETEIARQMKEDPELNRQNELVQTIPGIGKTSATLILAEFGPVERFENAGQMAAYAGLVPRHHQSGSSVRKRSRLSKTGSARVRKGIYMPAVAAMNHNPLMIEFAERLRRNGKPTQVIICAVMRKLIHLSYGVLKSGTPFDPQHLERKKIKIHA